MSLLYIPLVLGGAFILPFAMAWLEKSTSAPTRRAVRRESAD